jgi:hypothetical protein
MKKIALFVTISILYAFVPIVAQNRRMSPEEFQAKQKAFIIEEAKLTPEESARFFPIFFKLQATKKALMDKGWKSMHFLRDGNASEAEYAQAVIQMYDSRIATDKLDRLYLSKYARILPYSKIYKVMHAEMDFHRQMLRSFHH